MEYIIAFKSTSAAVKAEQLLAGAGLRAGVLPLPAQIRAGCGICTSLQPGEIGPALDILEGGGLEEILVFSREERGGGYLYAEVADRDALPEAGFSGQMYQPAKGSLPGRDLPADGLVVVIGRDSMGDGPQELGKILLKSFVHSLTELPAPPACLIFFNAGALLAAEGAATTESLQKLAGQGVRILVCGTCANYFDLQDKLAVGEITNMYEITEKMATARHLINI